MDKGEAFSIPTYVLQHTMNGQDWPDGDELYHQWLLCPTLLIYGAQDKLVTLKEEQHMEEVSMVSVEWGHGQGEEDFLNIAHSPFSECPVCCEAAIDMGNCACHFD